MAIGGTGVPNRLARCTQSVPRVAARGLGGVSMCPFGAIVAVTGQACNREISGVALPQIHTNPKRKRGEQRQFPRLRFGLVLNVAKLLAPIAQIQQVHRVHDAQRVPVLPNFAADLQ